MVILLCCYSGYDHGITLYCRGIINIIFNRYWLIISKLRLDFLLIILLVIAFFRGSSLICSFSFSKVRSSCQFYSILKLCILRISSIFYSTYKPITLYSKAWRISIKCCILSNFTLMTSRRTTNQSTYTLRLKSHYSIIERSKLGK